MFGVAPVPSHEVQNFRLTPYQEFIHKTRYSRWIAGRRESWRETVSRYIEFMVSDVVIRVDENRRDEVTTFLRSTVFDYIYTMKSMPSMRCMMTAGEALRRDNIAAYNCSYIAVSSPSDFSEALYILLNGTGVGFSCEREFVEQLPIVPSLQKSGHTIVVGDSKEGWAQAYKELVDGLYDGKIHTWDTSLVRPAGQRLKTFGGRSSGPEPLENLFNFTINAFLRAQGRRLEPIEVHDLMCMIGEIVVVGGVRRSALISLSDLDDKEMRHAKSGEWWKTTPWRGLANNSVAYKTTPAREVFDHEWQALVDSKSGERGIFNRESSQVQAAKYGRRPISISYGCNPCSEIILRSRQFCNLSEVIARAGDTILELTNKVKICTILGTLQATLTNFNFISDEWVKNTVEEALLGVSITGIMDNPILSGQLGTDLLQETLDYLREVAVETNKVWAEILHINPAAAVTAVKPSGTISQLCDTASGIHARHAKHFWRRVRIDKKDPVYHLVSASDMHVEDDYMRPHSTAVIRFPQVAPESAITRHDMTAIEQLEIWKIYQLHWCEHKPSVTISVRDDEWNDVREWVWNNFSVISGISFLPFADHTYQQAPYEDAHRADVLADIERNAYVDWEDLPKYEIEDTTTSSQTLACHGNVCEL